MAGFRTLLERLALLHKLLLGFAALLLLVPTARCRVCIKWGSCTRASCRYSMPTSSCR